MKPPKAVSKVARRGGKRKGAGRKPTGHKTVRVMFSLHIDTVQALAVVPQGERSKFVDELILEHLKP